MLRHTWVTDTLATSTESIPERGKEASWSIYICYSPSSAPFTAGFIVGTPLKVYHFLAPSKEEKTSWFRDLHSHIFTQKKLFHKVAMHNNMYAL